MVNSLGSFFMAPHKSSSSLWLFPFPPYDKFKNSLLLCSTRSRKLWQHTLFPLTFVYSLVPMSLALHEIPTNRGILVQKGCFSKIKPHVSDVNFSNNISIPQVLVNIKKTEHDTTFENS